MYPYDTYPYMHITNHAYSKVDFYLAIASLACPIFPIIVSAVICMTTILWSRTGPRGGNTCSGTGRMRTKATVTVLIFTLVYVVCNIPIAVCVGRWAILSLTKVDIFRGPNLFLARYIWPITYVALVQLNALVNPFVYLSRMDAFRLTTRKIIRMSLLRRRPSIRIHGTTVADEMRYNVHTYRVEYSRSYEMGNLTPAVSQNGLSAVSLHTVSSVKDFGSVPSIACLTV
jgi:hypothetical protein